MRLLAHVHSYPPKNNAGGPTAMHSLLLEAKRRRGWDVSVLVDANGEDYEWEGIPVVSTRVVPTMRGIYASADVVLTSLHTTIRADDLARGMNKPLVHLVHNERQLNNWKVRPRPHDIAIFNTRWLKGVSNWSARSCVLHPHVDADRVLTKTEDPNITLVNRTANKGADLFYTLAIANPQWDFVAVDGGYGDQLPLPRNTGDGPWNLYHMANQSDPREIYRMTGVLLAPSASESWGLAPIEAALSGIPTIGAPTNGFIESGICWRLIDRTSVGDWTAALHELMGSEELRLEVGEQAREMATLLCQLSDVEVDLTLDLIAS